MSEHCQHLEPADEAYEVSADGREKPITVLLCTWAQHHPASAEKLLDVPRWLQREALGGHLWRKGDCEGCPGYSAMREQASGR